MTTSQAIEIRSVGLSRGTKAILADVSLTVARGERTALVGASGVGKSTLLQIVAGLTRPSTGRVVVNGQPVMGPHASVTMMLQRPALLPWASVLENVMLGLRFSGAVGRDPARAKARAFELLQQVGLADRVEARPVELSGGEQQRVALARALAPQPSVLLLDEPFSALDPTTRATLRSDVAAMADATGVTLLLVTHDMTDASALCRRAIRLGGQPATVISDERSPSSSVVDFTFGQLQSAA